MKKLSVVAILLAVLLSGCATRSPFLGEWASQDLGKGETAALYISDDGTWAIFMKEKDKSHAEGATGTWTSVTETTVSLDIPGEESGTGKLLNKDTLLITGGGDAYYLNRKK